MAYLMGPLVMLVVGAAIWAANHHDSQGSNRERRDRWLDTHYVDLMHHKH